MATQCSLEPFPGALKWTYFGIIEKVPCDISNFTNFDAHHYDQVHFRHRTLFARFGRTAQVPDALNNGQMEN